MRVHEIVALVKRYVSKSISEAIQNTVTVNNLNATAAPTATNDVTEKYSKGSLWVYSGVTYTCVDATENKAAWIPSTQMYYFSTWDELVTAITAVGVTYVGKYAEIANANGSPSSGQTYTAPNALTDYIFDGGSATIKINAQGANYSVTTQTRTVTNPVVKSVMLTAAVKPTVPGYYIFAVVPTGGLPTGVSVNDIAYFDGITWSCWQKYASATTVIVAGATLLSQVTWRKFNGTWMSTADDYVPDAKEYQTGKLWNGKAVYRKCSQGTTHSSLENTLTGMVIPTTGTMIMCLGSLTRIDNAKFTCGYSNSLQFLFSKDLGSVTVWTNVVDFRNRPYIVWVEYTKS